MPLIHIEEIQKQKVEYQIYERYKTEISELQKLGFEDLQFTREVSFPFSALLMFFAYFPMRMAGEIVRVEGPLRFVLFHPLLLHHEYDTYGQAFGMGVKLLTLLEDNGVLISCNYPTTNYVNPKRGLFRYDAPSGTSIAACFEAHQNRIEMLEKSGHVVNRQLNLNNYEIVQHLDDVAQF